MVETYLDRKNNLRLEKLPFSGNFILTKKAIDNVDEIICFAPVALDHCFVAKVSSPPTSTNTTLRFEAVAMNECARLPHSWSEYSIFFAACFFVGNFMKLTMQDIKLRPAVAMIGPQHKII